MLHFCKNQIPAVDTHNLASLQYGDDGGGGCASPRNAHRYSFFRKNGISTFLILLFLFTASLFNPQKAYAEWDNTKNIESDLWSRMDITATWDAKLRYIQVKVPIANQDGADDYFHAIDVYVSATGLSEKKIVFSHGSTEPTYESDGNIKMYLGTNQDYGKISINGSTSTSYSWYEFSGGPKGSTTYELIYATFYFYPNEDLLGKDLKIKAQCYEYGVDRSKYSGNMGECHVNVTPTNPMSTIELQNLKYMADGHVSFTVNRPKYSSNYDANGQVGTVKIVLEMLESGMVYKTSGVNVSNSASFNATSSPDYPLTGLSLSKAEITSGTEYRLKYYVEASGNAGATYTQYSNRVTLAPIKYPTDIKVEKVVGACGDNNAGRLKITWNTSSVMQDPDAGYVVIYRDAVGSNDKILVDYTAKQAYYEIPASDIGKGNQTYNFKLMRDPITVSDYAESASSETINMDYRKTTSLELTRKGSKTFTASWKYDGGFYCDSYHYDVYLKQGSEQFTSSTISISKSTADVDASNAPFNFCEEINVTLRMYDTKDSIVGTYDGKYLFVDDSKASSVTSVTASKGYYSSRVQIGWTVNDDNQFAKYLVYRREYGTNASLGTLIADVTHSSGVTNYSIDDNNAVPGTFYQYEVQGQQDCGTNLIKTISRMEDIGYIQPYGTVSGRITYEGSESVAGVVVRAEGNSEAKNKALEFGGATHIETPYVKNMLDPSAFSYQAWVNVKAEATGKQTLMDAAGKYAVEIDAANKVNLLVYKSATAYDTYTFDTIIGKIKGEYNHISITYQKSGTQASAFLYLNGDSIQKLTKAGLASSYTFPTSRAVDSLIYIGQTYGGANILKGYMDELRLWTKALTTAEIVQNYNCYISGKDNALKLYYRFDEIEINEAFDISCNNSVYNANNGSIIGTANRNITITPTPEQLSIKAITDENGNYLINTIPYTGDGNTYNIVPSMGDAVTGVHKFNPNNTPLYFSSTSTTHNNVNFTDVSSFTVTGVVYYEGGSYPVKDCTFEIDGKSVMTANGAQIKSGTDGTFTISVPIGQHSLRVVKTGHTFANDGYFKDNDGIDYVYNKTVPNDKISAPKFYDQTKVKLIGRVVGGGTEDGKPLGFCESVNNLGVTSITLQATGLNTWYIVENEESAIYHHNDGQYRHMQYDPSAPKYPNPDYKIPIDDSTKVVYKQREIVINVSPTTGEFVAWVIPEAFTIPKIEVDAGNGGKLEIKKTVDNLDLSNSALEDPNYMLSEVRTFLDSTFISGTGVVQHWEHFNNKDSVRYHAKWTHRYQAMPTFAVKQIVNKQEVDYFGEESMEYVDDQLNKETVYFYKNGKETFGKPVFQQAKDYLLRFNAYEEYVNYVADPIAGKKTLYPIIDGTVNISNGLQVNTETEHLELDSLGILDYEFTGGPPNTLDAIKAISATLTIGEADYYWNWGNVPLQAYLLGDISTGTNFMSSGPSSLTTILRDPPGTGSSAFIEKGTSYTTTTKFTGNLKVLEEINAKTTTGIVFASFVGVGTGVINKAKAQADFNVGVNTEYTESSEEEVSAVTTFTEKFSTSDTPDYVGAPGDVFIGYATNSIFGITNGVHIQKIPVKDNKFFADTQEPGMTDFVIAPTSGFAWGPTFDTRFAFTEMELENIMIPKWKAAIKDLLEAYDSDKSKRPDPDNNTLTEAKYYSNLPEDDDNYGKWNCDAVFRSNPEFSWLKSTDGISYTIILPSSWTDLQKAAYQDSILWCNNQINMWEATLAQNEKEKVFMEVKGNYSFGGGATIEYSQANAKTSSYTYTHGTNVTPSLGTVMGGKINGVGLEVEIKTSVETGSGKETNTSSDTTVTTGFTLKEDGTLDELTVDYGVTSSGTYAFKTRGGQTSCPYEGEVLSKYYEPGKHVLQEATMQIEVPEITHSNGEPRAAALEIPANRTASFQLKLMNKSETNDDVYMQLVVDERSNPDGAELKIDGGIIGNGRTYLVRSGEALYKTLTVGKGSVDNYKDIGIILRSLCEGETLCDTAWVDVTFVPACSDVKIASPDNNFIANLKTPGLGGDVSIRLSDYDKDFPNLAYILIEYRRAGEASWTEAQRYYPAALYNEISNGVQGKYAVIPDQAITYNWKMDDVLPADGQYELRASTHTATIDGNNTIGQIRSSYYTDPITIYKDMVKPRPLGPTSPANGIYGLNDELSVTFSEEISVADVGINCFKITYGDNGTGTVQLKSENIVASSNKITFEYPKDQFELLEDKTLNIELTRVFDTHGNECDPIEWVAYVNRNPVVWDTDGINIVKEGGVAQTFTAKIKNASAEIQQYYFTNLLPSYLTVDQPTGSLTPMQVKELTFTISSGANLGVHNDYIGVSTGNGIVKQLPLYLKVTSSLPAGWALNPGDYESTMTITGNIQINGAYQTDPTDVLAAFIDDECVGMASPIEQLKPGYTSGQYLYYTFLTVYGNASHSGKEIKFKIWDSSTGNVYSVVESYIGAITQTFNFAANATHGTYTAPVKHNALNVIEQYLDLASGWNWVSVNVSNTSPAILQQFKDRIGSAGEQLKGQTAYVQAPTWNGTLNTIDKVKMYMVKTNAATSVRFDGTPADPATSPITLAANTWNWIGYTPQFTLPVSEALANYTATLNDQIKGQASYRTYAGSSIGWIGTLNYLRSGEGYMYNSLATTSQTFNYPSTSSQLFRASRGSTEEVMENRWTVDVYKYPTSMTMTSVVLDGNVELQSDMIEIGAFASNGECRGSILLQNVPQLTEHPYLGFLMVFGEDGDRLTLKVYDHATGEEYTASNDVRFVTNAIHGTPDNPYPIRPISTGINLIGGELAIYPNPVVDQLMIKNYESGIEKVAITDVTGKIIYNSSTLTGNSIDVSGYASGVYIIRFTTPEGIVTRKFVKK